MVKVETRLQRMYARQTERVRQLKLTKVRKSKQLKHKRMIARAEQTLRAIKQRFASAQWAAHKGI